MEISGKSPPHMKRQTEPHFAFWHDPPDQSSSRRLGMKKRPRLERRGYSGYDRDCLWRGLLLPANFRGMTGSGLVEQFRQVLGSQGLIFDNNSSDPDPHEKQILARRQFADLRGDSAR
jgi:hypothetical protein